MTTRTEGAETYRLTLPPRLWREEFARLARGDRLAWSFLRRSVRDDLTELVAIPPLDPLRESETGRDFGSLDDLLLVRFAENVSAAATDAWLDRFRPANGQSVVALLLGVGPAAGAWCGSVADHARRRPLDEFLLVGAGMRRIARTAAPHSADPHDRWSRTRGALGDDVWQRVRASRAAVVGVSRNGSAAAFGLAMLGVRELVLIDPDRDEWHNLDATPGATPEGLGDFKVLNRRAALLASRPDDLAVDAFPVGLPHPLVEERLQSADLICSCVDRDAPRLVCSRLARRWSKLHLDIGTGVFMDGDGERRRIGGDVRLLLPGEACVLCLGGLRDAELARDEADAPPGALRRGRQAAWHEDRAGSLLTVNHAAVHVGLQLWLAVLSGQIARSQWLRLEWTGDGLPTIERRDTPLSVCGDCRRNDPA